MTTVVGGCGVLALVLSTIGVYGTIADAVRRRTAEIGLRVALGARRREVVALVFREGLFLTATGVIVGTLGAVVVARVARSFVHSLPLPDLVSLGSVSLTLVLVAVGAAILRCKPRAAHQPHNRAPGGIRAATSRNSSIRRGPCPARRS